MKAVVLFLIRIVVLLMSSPVLFMKEKPGWVHMFWKTFGVDYDVLRGPTDARRAVDHFLASPEEKRKTDNGEVLTWNNITDWAKEYRKEPKTPTRGEWEQEHAFNVEVMDMKHRNSSRVNYPVGRNEEVFSACLRDGKGAPVRNRYSHLNTAGTPHVKPMIQNRVAIEARVAVSPDGTVKYRRLDPLERFGCLTDLPLPTPSIQPMVMYAGPVHSVFTPVKQQLDLLERYGCLTDLGEY